MKVEMRDETKVCANCAHMKSIVYGERVCLRDGREINLVTGLEKKTFCTEARSNQKDCGPSGKFYQERIVCKECQKKDAIIAQLEIHKRELSSIAQKTCFSMMQPASPEQPWWKW